MACAQGREWLVPEAARAWARAPPHELLLLGPSLDQSLNQGSAWGTGEARVVEFWCLEHATLMLGSIAHETDVYIL